jgi:hypothetical protein
VGIYVDPYEADPIDPHEFGSEHRFMMELSDKLQKQILKVTFDLIKGGFEKRGLLEGVIIEKLHAGKKQLV